MCTTGVCIVQQDRMSNLVIQQCSNTILYIIACAHHNYNTLNGGNIFCCAEDYCNSAENFWEFRANLSATTTNSVGQGTSSTDNLISETSWIPTASSTGEIILFCMSSAIVTQLYCSSLMVNGLLYVVDH